MSSSSLYVRLIIFNIKGFPSLAKRSTTGRTTTPSFTAQSCCFTLSLLTLQKYCDKNIIYIILDCYFISTTFGVAKYIVLLIEKRKTVVLSISNCCITISSIFSLANCSEVIILYGLSISCSRYNQ